MKDLSEIEFKQNSGVELYKHFPIINETKKQILILGNTIGMFGFIPFNSNKGDDLKRFGWFIDIIRKNSIISIVGEQEEWDYYKKLLKIMYNNKWIDKSYKKNFKWYNSQDYIKNKKTDYTKILDEFMKHNIKFDVCIMNPPYNKNLHLKFIEKTFKLINKNGVLINISPDDWITNKFAFADKSKIKNEFRNNFLKYIDEIEEISTENFNNLFGTSWGGHVSIEVFKYNAKGIDLNKYMSNNKLLNEIIIKIKQLPSLRSKFIRKIKDDNFVSVRRTNHKYLNWVEKNNKINAKDGILFSTNTEKENFINSFDTWFYKYLCCTEWPGCENSAHIPFMENYSEPWTDERFYKYFNISENEKNEILNLIQNNENLW